ncbi:lipid A biosynthesis acyltransferase [Sulfurimonas sp. SAG-AH-194-I05]|nr:lipid A biosynthesis lauroyl acyltransferase [Sulfurimonas sp. SAG-AH-194-I05]MDF1874396.1 lipid A biosynthesis acyltransferase [Sulfurimonas sp. SAG-AH-194-I05]
MIGFYSFLFLEKFLMLLPKNLRRTIFIFLGYFAYKVSKRYNKVIRQNLQFIYGENVSEAFIQKTAKYSFKLLLLNFLYTMENRYYPIEEIAKKVSFENEDVVKKAQEQNRPIVFITSHYGAWELGGAMISSYLEPLMIVFKKMKNKRFQNYLLSSRAQSKIQYVERAGATRGLLKQLRSGGAIALLIDTNVNKKQTVTVDFLGKPTGQIKTTAYFARKFDAVIIPVLIHTTDDATYTVKFYDAITPPKTDDEKEDIKVSTQMQTDWLSQEILKSPQPWFWLHRRWKNDYPEVYKK